MALNPTVMQAVEKLDYRVTVGDIASQAGLNVNVAQRDLLALASETQAHLQVSEAGEVAYQFPKDFRAVLRNKHFKLQLQELWAKIWGVLFYLIRISFGIMLLVSIALIFIAIALILIAMSSAGRDDNDGDGGFSGGFVFWPRFWFGPDLFWFFDPYYYNRGGYYSRGQSRSQRRRGKSDDGMNFFEAVFSFLFGDGDPNANLEERRWQAIGTVIRNNKGAVVAEQVAPYLDDLGQGYDREYESYMLPVLTRFNGHPQVSPEGELVYHFPELQVSAEQQRNMSVSAYLKEAQWKFSQASSSQLMWAIGLGGVNIIGALVLGSLLADGTIAAQIGGLVAFVGSIYGLLLAYGVAFLAVPLVRYFWIQFRNQKVVGRNEQRQEAATALNQAGPQIQKKLTYARQFATETVVRRDDLAYTTETDLIEQEVDRADKLDAEWQQRLNQSGS